MAFPPCDASPFDRIICFHEALHLRCFHCNKRLCDLPIDYKGRPLDCLLPFYAMIEDVAGDSYAVRVQGYTHEDCFATWRKSLSVEAKLTMPWYMMRVRTSNVLCNCSANLGP